MHLPYFCQTQHHIPLRVWKMQHKTVISGRCPYGGWKRKIKNMFLINGGELHGRVFTTDY